VKTILLIGAGRSSRDVVARLKGAGLRILLVELPEAFDPEKCAGADEILITDYRKAEFPDLVSAMRRVWRFDAAVSITESGVKVAAELNERFGVRTSSPSAIGRLNNKSLMRFTLESCGFSELAWQRVTHEHDVARAAERCGFPLIIKPESGAGSYGVRRASDLPAALRAVDELRRQRLAVLAEQYIEGQEYSVESFSFAGRHVVVAVTQKVVNEQFVEIGHVVPAPLSHAVTQEIKAFVVQFLQIIGITDGPCHTEMKIGPRGMKIVESHNRPGGGNICRLVELVYGIDLHTLTAQWACDAVPPLSSVPDADGAAAVSFFMLPAGKLIGVGGLQELTRNKAVDSAHCYFKEGDIVPPLTDNSGRGGYVIARAGTAAAALDMARECAGNVQAIAPDDPVRSPAAMAI
jgi:carbamoylphosphate synthase large subunit